MTYIKLLGAGYLFDAPQSASWLACLLLLLLAALFSGHKRREGIRLLLGAGSDPKEAVTRRGEGRRLILLCLAWVAATVALMEPKGNGRRLTEEEREVAGQELIAESGEKVMGRTRRPAHDILFLLDASASMGAKDTRGGMSRLCVAKEIIDEVSSGLDGQSAALYAFTSELTPLVPPTLDYLYLRLFARRAELNEGDVAGTDLTEALDGLIRRHRGGGSEKRKSLILLTDGGDTHLEQASAGARAEELDVLVSRLEGAVELGFKVITIGLGSHEGELIPGVQFDGKPVRSQLDEELLRRLAEKGKGRYLFADDSSTLACAQEILKEIRRNELFEEVECESAKGEVEREVKERSQMAYDRYFQIPVALSLLLLSLALLLPEGRRARG